MRRIVAFVSTVLAFLLFLYTIPVLANEETIKNDERDMNFNYTLGSNKEDRIMKLFKQIQSIMGKKTSSEQSSPMSQEALAALDENSLYTAISDFFLQQEEQKTEEVFWKEMSENARIIYTAQSFEIEVNNGGIQQYLENNSGKTAPYLSYALQTLNAKRYLELWKDFLSRAGLDDVTLSQIAAGGSQDRLEAVSEEAFEEFDKSFYKLESEDTLERRIVEYAREHLEAIFELEH